MLRMQLTRRHFYICHSFYHFLYLLWIVLPFNLNDRNQPENPNGVQSEIQYLVSRPIVELGLAKETG